MLAAASIAIAPALGGHSLRQALDFYVNRDLQPWRFYPRDATGEVIKYNDLPMRYRTNIDSVDPPFNRRPGDQPALTPREIEDIIAFLDTLTDGYRKPGRRGVGVDSSARELV